ncbi:MAG: phage major capsid domain-containing protein, partial [Candidatus Fonsibacter sp.]
HSLVSVMSCTINNNTVNLNVQESLPILLRMVDPEEFSKYVSLTPTALDFLANYEDAVKRQEFQIDATAAAGAAQNRSIVYFPGAVERGPADDNAVNGARPFSYASYQNNVLAYDMNRPTGTAYYHKPRCSWKVNRIYALDDAGNPCVPILADTVVYVEFDVCEPLLLSPFVFGSGYGKQGFYGIHSMTFSLFLTGNAN